MALRGLMRVDPSPRPVDPCAEIVAIARLHAGSVVSYSASRMPERARLTRGENTMPDTRWKISGQYMESCNCDYLCPCIFTNPQAPATYDHCTSLQVYRIERGTYGDLKLDGLAFALIIRSGKVMSQGNWIFAGSAARHRARRGRGRAGAHPG
jgi:hypothetical protein